MSLINSVLRDLDKRRAGDRERAALPNEVRPLPAAETPAVSRPLLLGALAVVAAGGAWLTWPQLFTFALPSPALPVPAAVPPPAVPVAVVPPPPAAAPPPMVVAEPVEPVPSARPADQSLRLDDTLATVPSAPAREKPKEAVKPAETRRSSAPPPAAAAPAKPVAESVPPATAKAAPSPAPEDDWSRAQSLLRENRAGDAEPLLRQLLQRNPGQTAVRQALVGLLMAARRHAEAADVLREGLALSPEQAAWAMSLARVQAERNDYAGAWETLSRSQGHAQQQADYLAFCGTVLQRLNRSGDAAGYYQAALRIKPQEGRWWVGLGIALEAERKPAEAREAFQRARSTGSLSPDLAAYVDQKLR